MIGSNEVQAEDIILPSDKRIIAISAIGSNMGQEFTEYLLDNEYQVIGFGGKNSEQFTNKIKARYPQDLLDFFYCDYFNTESIAGAIKSARLKYPKLDGFIHLVGGSLFNKPVSKLKTEEFTKVLNLNLTSAYTFSKYIFDWLQNSDGGHMVFFGSTTGIKPSGYKLPYAVAKAGVHMLVKALAKEGADFNILVNGIVPGYVMTARHIEELELKAEKNSSSIQSEIDLVKQKNPLRGELNTEDMFPVLALLLTTNVITGQNVTVDLGQTDL